MEPTSALQPPDFLKDLKPEDLDIIKAAHPDLMRRKDLQFLAGQGALAVQNDIEPIEGQSAWTAIRRKAGFHTASERKLKERQDKLYVEEYLPHLKMDQAVQQAVAIERAKQDFLSPPTIGQMPQAVRDAAGINPLKTVQAQGPFLDFGGAPPGLAAGTARRANYLRGYQQPAGPDANGLSGELPAISPPEEALLRRTSGIEGAVTPADIARLMPETLPGQISQAAPPTAQVPDLDRAPLAHEKAAYAIALPKAIADYAKQRSPERVNEILRLASDPTASATQALDDAELKPIISSRQHIAAEAAKAPKTDVHFQKGVDENGKPVLYAVKKDGSSATIVPGAQLETESGSLSTLGKLYQEREHFKPGTPQHADYTQAIAKEIAAPQLATRLESLAKLRSAELYPAEPPMTFAQLASRNPKVGAQVRQQAEMTEPLKIAEANAFAGQRAQLEVPDKPSPSERKEVTEELGVIQRLRDLGTLYDQAYVGPVRGRLGQAMEYTGIGMTEHEADFRAEVSTIKNQVIKQVTGAQMSEPEANRIMRQIPDSNNPPEVFKARRERTETNTLILAHIHREVLQGSGIDTTRLPKLPPIPAKHRKEYDRMRGESIALHPEKVSEAPATPDNTQEDSLTKAKREMGIIK